MANKFPAGINNFYLTEIQERTVIRMLMGDCQGRIPCGWGLCPVHTRTSHLFEMYHRDNVANYSHSEFCEYVDRGSRFHNSEGFHVWAYIPVGRLAGVQAQFRELCEPASSQSARPSTQRALTLALQDLDEQLSD